MKKGFQSLNSRNLFLVFFLLADLNFGLSPNQQPISEQKEGSIMKLRSSAFSPNGKIPRIYSCQGKSINPPLEISEVPKEAKSLVLIMDDPDVPEKVRKDKMFVHWVVYNIDPILKKIEENAKPFGILGKNTAGDLGYTGPCPPDREHRYFFKLYALDTLLSLQEGATKEEVLKAMEGHILQETSLMGTYVKV